MNDITVEDASIGEQFKRYSVFSIIRFQPSLGKEYVTATECQFTGYHNERNWLLQTLPALCTTETLQYSIDIADGYNTLLSSSGEQSFLKWIPSDTGCQINNTS